VEFHDIRPLEKPFDLPTMARELAAMIKRA
jgi:hypothetical protein